ncbi:arylsulfatase regulator [Klebsiella pneumoniae]|uniref:Arylsulfatase regulator n=1 Tax=Klebsiella pneumoniae TaxID=573 RepID=A0A377UXA6_KLEPN|nr:arylsulfatase regulator [Klebsiella pneumoniae]
MLNIAALRQQQIPLAAEPRSPVPFHILMKPIGPPAISPAAIAITRRTKRRSTRWMTRG